MEELLKQINAVAGTIGSMLYDDHGRLISHLFPKIFDNNTLGGAAKTVSENLPGLEDITGGVKAADFRFQGGRVLVIYRKVAPEGDGDTVEGAVRQAGLQPVAVGHSLVGHLYLLA